MRCLPVFRDLFFFVYPAEGRCVISLAWLFASTNGSLGMSSGPRFFFLLHSLVPWWLFALFSPFVDQPIVRLFHIAFEEFCTCFIFWDASPCLGHFFKIYVFFCLSGSVRMITSSVIVSYVACFGHLRCCPYCVWFDFAFLMTCFILQSFLCLSVFMLFNMRWSSSNRWH